jgi:hypothetical protein
LDEDAWRRVLEVNLTGPFLCSKAVLPLMREKGWGRIVNIASVAAKRISFTGAASYTASKAGLLGFTRHLAYEVAALGINVNAICPGPTLTAMYERNADEGTRRERVAMVPKGRFLTPDDTGRVAVFLCSEAADSLCGLAIDRRWRELARLDAMGEVHGQPAAEDSARAMIRGSSASLAPSTAGSTWLAHARLDFRIRSPRLRLRLAHPEYASPAAFGRRLAAGPSHRSSRVSLQAPRGASRWPAWCARRCSGSRRPSKLAEFPRPSIGADDALLRIEACGICGSDYEQYEGAAPSTEDYTQFPVIPGHEPLGVIEEIGARARERWGVAEGDRVAVRSGYGCGRCAACARFDTRACRTRGGTYGYTDVAQAALSLGRVRGAHVSLPALAHEEDGSGIPAPVR